MVDVLSLISQLYQLCVALKSKAHCSILSFTDKLRVKV